MLKANKLLEIKIPHDPPSNKILEMATKESLTENQTEEETNIEQEMEIQRSLGRTDEDMEREETEDEMPDLEQIKGNDLGLEVIKKKKSEGWPKDTITVRRIITKGIEEGKYKWLYTAKACKEEEIYNCLTDNDINLEGCWRFVEDQIFRKIRNCLFQDRAPPPARERPIKISE